METRARYVLIGAFTLFSLLAALGFLLWLAKVQIDRTYTRYDILFDTVAGLNQASAVRYNGIDVGKVLTIALDTDDPAKVRVRIEVNATTPVRIDTVATLASQGVTGVSFVSLAGGDANAPGLVTVPPANVAVIPSEPSVVQGLMDDVPDLLAKATTLIEQVSSFVTPENQDAVTGILANLNAATARLDALSVRAERLMDTAQNRLEQADATLTAVQTTFEAAQVSLAQADATLAAAQTTFDGANGVINDDLPAIIARLGEAANQVAAAAGDVQDFAQGSLPQFAALATDARGLVANLDALTNRVGSDPGRFLLGSQTPTYRNAP